MSVYLSIHLFFQKIFSAFILSFQVFLNIKMKPKFFCFSGHRRLPSQIQCRLERIHEPVRDKAKNSPRSSLQSGRPFQPGKWTQCSVLCTLCSHQNGRLWWQRRHPVGASNPPIGQRQQQRVHRCAATDHTVRQVYRRESQRLVQNGLHIGTLCSQNWLETRSRPKGVDDGTMRKSGKMWKIVIFFTKKVWSMV